jgi:hypothetical protein
MYLKVFHGVSRLLASAVIGASVFSSALASATVFVDSHYTATKSHLQLLADNELLSAPLLTYPLQWNLLYQQLQHVDASQLADDVKLAWQFLYHHAQQIQQGKNQSRIAIQYASSPFVSNNNAVDAAERFKVAASHFGYQGNFAYHLQLQYRDGQLQYRDEPAAVLDDDLYYFQHSYLAYAWQRSSLSLNMSQKQWGNSLLSNNQLSDVNSGLVSLDGRYLWHTGSVVASVMYDNQHVFAEELAALRIEQRLFKQLDIGLGYNTALSAFTAQTHNQDEWREVAVDTRLTLPRIVNIQPGLYASYTQSTSVDDAYLVGVDSQWLVGVVQTKLNLEYQKKYHNLENANGSPSAIAHNYLFSVAMYLPQAQQVAFIWQQYDELQQVDSNYKFLLFDGLMGLGYHFREQRDKNNDHSAVIDWEYRF